MRLAKTVGFVLLAAHLEVWVACSGWRPQRSPDEPMVEYRVSQPDAGGRTEYMLTIDRGGQVLVQPPLPSPPGSKTLHTQLTCAERAELPDVMKREIAKLRPVYGLDEDGTGNQGLVSVLYRGKWMEKRVVWRNPPSKPEPPGGWYQITGMLDDIKRRAEETNEAKSRAAGSFIVYGKSSSGKVGTYHYSLSINQSGSAVVMGGLGAASYRRRGQTQLTAEELATLLRTIQEAKIADFQQCYGRHAEVNEQSVSLTYHWDGNAKDVLWMSPPDEPKPPQGWFKIVEILDQIWTRAEKKRADQ